MKVFKGNFITIPVHNFKELVKDQNVY